MTVMPTGIGGFCPSCDHRSSVAMSIKSSPMQKEGFLKGSK
jgi:hypothetical protein